MELSVSAIRINVLWLYVISLIVSYPIKFESHYSMLMHFGLQNLTYSYLTLFASVKIIINFIVFN